MVTPRQTDPQFKLRLTTPLKQGIEKAAAENNRSMNAEIVSRLEASFEPAVKLPPNLRERVQGYAARYSRSVDEEVIRVLEREYPEPWSLDSRVNDLVHLMHVMRMEGVNDDTVDALNEQLYQTAHGIASGRVKGVSDEARASLRDRLQQWEAENQEDQHYRYTESMDDEELERINRGEDPFKVE